MQRRHAQSYPHAAAACCAPWRPGLSPVGRYLHPRRRPGRPDHKSARPPRHDPILAWGPLRTNPWPRIASMLVPPLLLLLLLLLLLPRPLPFLLLLLLLLLLLRRGCGLAARQSRRRCLPRAAPVPNQHRGRWGGSRLGSAPCPAGPAPIPAPLCRRRRRGRRGGEGGRGCSKNDARGRLAALQRC
jgi:hypothetical protein